MAVRRHEEVLRCVWLIQTMDRARLGLASRFSCEPGHVGCAISGIGSTYRVIAPDLRGHGESPAPEGVYTIDEMADDVVELLDWLPISERIVLGGLSMGGYVGSRWSPGIPIACVA